MVAIPLKHPSLPRRLGWRTVGALFAACVGLMLGAVPGWTMCFAAWLVLSWLILGPMFLCTLVMAMAVALAGRGPAAWRSELRQLAALGVAMLAMLPMGMESTWVELAQARADLQARADEHARAGGPRVAITPASTDGLWIDDGFVYDPDDVLAVSPERRPAAWRNDPVLTLVDSDCRGIRRFVGPYYRWNDSCG